MRLLAGDALETYHRTSGIIKQTEVARYAHAQSVEGPRVHPAVAGHCRSCCTLAGPVAHLHHQGKPPRLRGTWYHYRARAGPPLEACASIKNALKHCIITSATQEAHERTVSKSLERAVESKLYALNSISVAPLAHAHSQSDLSGQRASGSDLLGSMTQRAGLRKSQQGIWPTFAEALRRRPAGVPLWSISTPDPLPRTMRNIAMAASSSSSSVLLRLLLWPSQPGACKHLIDLVGKAAVRVVPKAVASRLIYTDTPRQLSRRQHRVMASVACFVLWHGACFCFKRHAHHSHW